MAKTTNKLTATAGLFYRAFETKTRDDGKSFVSLKSGSPQWMTDAVRAAHQDIMPNDWVYDHCESIAERMADTDPDSWDDSIGEWADSLTDVYNADRAAWLASNIQFGGVVDEAVEEMGHSDQGVYGDIGIGQYRFIEQIAYALVSAVRDEVEADAD